jgi:hypothetical protein
MSEAELKQRTQEILTLLRVGADKAMPIDRRPGTKVWEEYLDDRIVPIVRQKIKVPYTSVDNLTPEELQEIYQSRDLPV